MDSMVAKREPEDVRAAAKIAGIPVTSNKPVQLLHFSPTLITEDVQLVQLTKDIANKLKTGQRVVIKGMMNDDAVMCTDDSTHELRICETSNSLLLCPELMYSTDPEYKNKSNNSSSNHYCTMDDEEVVGCVSNILEIKKCQPKLNRLKELLLEAPYKGQLEEKINTDCTNKYTFDDLSVLVQASRSEIEEALVNLQACLIDGYWRVFDVEYRDSLVQQILTLLEEQDWSWRSVPLDACCEKLSELHPPFAVKHCLECYGIAGVNEEDDKGTVGAGGTIVYELKEEDICKFYAEILLRAAGKFNYHEFMECWQLSVPVGMNTDISLLKGLALKDLKTVPPVVWFYPVSNLPKEPQERFAKLFSVRTKWTYEDLEPYIEDMVTSSSATTLNSLLLKYTRVSTGPDGVKLYNSKLTTILN